MICPKCGTPIEGGYRPITCPNCGRTYDSNQLENEYDTLKTETWDLDLKEILGYGKRKVCSNCKKRYIEGDRYCRYCGAPMGKPDYIEYNVPSIYGPPPTERLHTCEQCGFKWKTYSMLDEERFCPECGGAAPAVVVSRSKDEDSIPISLESTSENGDSDDHKTTNPILDIVRMIQPTPSGRFTPKGQELDQMNNQTTEDPIEFLSTLKKVFDLGLITQSEYDSKRAEVLNRL